MHTQATQNKQSSNENSGKRSGRNQGNDTFQFVDNRPEAIVQKNFQDLANKQHASVAQLKPADFQNQNRLTYDGTANNPPTLVNTAAQRANVSVAYPFNALAELGMLDSGDAPLTGGHMFKAQYGGIDAITNVVPWNSDTESKYSTFENAYQRNCINRAKPATGQVTGQVADIDLVTSAKFAADSSKRRDVANALRGKGDSSDTTKKHTLASLIQYASESVPASVEAHAEVGGTKVADLKFTSSKLVDKKSTNAFGVVKMFEKVKEADAWTGKAQTAITKLSEWETIDTQI
ncbi:hypothetical protein D3C87_85080 [compost metagenome]